MNNGSGSYGDWPEARAYVCQSPTLLVLVSQSCSNNKPHKFAKYFLDTFMHFMSNIFPSLGIF